MVLAIVFTVYATLKMYQLIFLSYAYSVVYFTFRTVAILVALNSVACAFVTCSSINAQYSI